MTIFGAAFETEYRRIFSRLVPGMTIEILNWGLTVSTPSEQVSKTEEVDASRKPQPQGTRLIHCDVTDQQRAAAVFERTHLQPGDYITGPALIVESQTTTLVSCDFEAMIDGGRNILLTRIEDFKS